MIQGHHWVDYVHLQGDLLDYFLVCPEAPPMLLRHHPYWACSWVPQQGIGVQGCPPFGPRPVNTGLQSGDPEHGKSYVYWSGKVLPTPRGCVVQKAGSCLWIDVQITSLEAQLQSYIRHFSQSDDLSNIHAISHQNAKYTDSVLYTSIHPAMNPNTVTKPNKVNSSNTIYKT